MKYSDLNKKIPSASVAVRQKVLVTGATGFLGGRLVEVLVEKGFPVRALARKQSDTERLKKLNVEIYYGDVGIRESLESAFREIDFVIHAAAGTSGKERDNETGTVSGTMNILELCRESGVRKLIYISSCSVYGTADYKTNQIVHEESPLERFPLKRGYYSASKQRAEISVVRQMKSGGVPVVIIRPGTIYGPGGNLYTPMMGLSFRNKCFIVIGNGKYELPLVYIDNLVEAIILSIQASAANNQIFNVVDSERINKRSYMEKLIKKLYPNAFVVYIPLRLTYLLVFVQEYLCRLLRKTPFLTCYRLTASQKQVRYDNSKIVERLNWQPEVTFEEAVNRIVNYKTIR